MISPTPWKVDAANFEIHDADGELIYRHGTGFVHADDWQAVAQILAACQPKERLTPRTDPPALGCCAECWRMGLTTIEDGKDTHICGKQQSSMPRIAGPFNLPPLCPKCSMVPAVCRCPRPDVEPPKAARENAVGLTQMGADIERFLEQEVCTGDDDHDGCGDNRPLLQRCGKCAKIHAFIIGLFQGPAENGG